MARRIQSADEAAGTPPVEEVPEGGVCFVNNLLNRKFTLPSGKEFKFGRTRETFTDRETIDYLTKLTKVPGSYIFFFEVQPTPQKPPDQLPPGIAPAAAPAPVAPFGTPVFGQVGPPEVSESQK